MSKNTSPYHEAGRILNELLSSKSGGRGLKSIAFSNSKTRGGPSKATYATVCKSMQHLPAINSVLNHSGGRLRKAIGIDTVHNKGLMYVMLYELLFGKYKSIRGGGRLKRMIVKHERELREGVSEHREMVDGLTRATPQFPRYARVNVMRTSIEAMAEMLKASFVENSTRESNCGDSMNLKRSIFMDPHVPDLLVMHPSASSFLHQDHDAVKSGKIVLQDKSSCFSALALARGNPNISLNCDFIDACAAPGNKTTHLAALVAASLADVSRTTKKGKNLTQSSTIFAFERSSSRFKTLKSRIDAIVPSSSLNKSSTKVVVQPLLSDFLKSDSKDPQFANVRGILLDPSCSGSGIVNSLDRWLEDAETDGNKDDPTTGTKADRIKSLSNFQLVALTHAMSFPSVDRIVYSTCSVNNEENELVVGKALSEVNKTINGSVGDEWILVAPACLDHWPRRGNPEIGGLSKTQAQCLIRCDGLDGDETNGFFVSYFERKRVRSESEDAERTGTSCSIVNDVKLPVYQGQFASIQETAPKTKHRLCQKNVNLMGRTHIVHLWTLQHVPP
ncbi:hypothetical protein HJC23_000044 [Cyclotella cryptica]|uniref:SAM-dependent MTase RsmB/NOP-type domain-containing protein n=1 Tax=Cyclotella cryptica TaxID=29204 RepID=A0ABD3NU71_9STRA|eukprot:CCRYP_019630-RA/>CCRYP_019630-RA protein AED:0.00 eAED:0.00 QI:121/-1/1/1/-1/1/1/344/560